MKKVMKDIFWKLMFSILKYYNFNNDLPFLKERMEIEKLEKPLPNLHIKTEYVRIIRNLKEVLNHGLVLKKRYKVIKFNHDAQLKQYIDMKTDLRKKLK